MQNFSAVICHDYVQTPAEPSYTLIICSIPLQMLSNLITCRMKNLFCLTRHLLVVSDTVYFLHWRNQQTQLCHTAPVFRTAVPLPKVPHFQAGEPSLFHEWELPSHASGYPSLPCTDLSQLQCTLANALWGTQTAATIHHVGGSLLVLSCQIQQILQCCSSPVNTSFCQM